MESQLSTAASTTAVKFYTLLDPLGDRRVKTLEPPANRPMEVNVLFPPSGKRMKPMYL
jgi:hypothetical protein